MYQTVGQKLCYKPNRECIVTALVVIINVLSVAFTCFLFREPIVTSGTAPLRERERERIDFENYFVTFLNLQWLFLFFFFFKATLALPKQIY